MFGILDSWYAYRKRRPGYTETPVPWTPRLYNHDNRKIIWLCFAPVNITKRNFARERLIPHEGITLVYTISSLQLIVPDAGVILSGLSKIYEHALDNAIAAHRSGFSLNVLGVSLGNVLSIRLAAEVKTKLRCLISIIGGGHLGLSAWDSLLTGHIVRRCGYKFAEDFEERMSSFSPATWVDKIRCDYVKLRLGSCDRLIRYGHGRKLYDGLAQTQQETGGYLDHKTYFGADHCSAMTLSVIER